MRNNLYCVQGSWTSGLVTNNLADVIQATSEEEAVGLLVNHGNERWPLPEWHMNSKPIVQDISALAVKFAVEERCLLPSSG